jgi:hypothetical protein
MVLELTTDAVELFLAWYQNRESALLSTLLEHPGYRAVLAHSREYSFNPISAADFEKAADGRDNHLKGLRNLNAHIDAIRGVAAQIEVERASILGVVEESLARVFPPHVCGDIGLHCIVGYDLGIGLHGDVAINLNSPQYLAEPGEVPYWLAHEATHVVMERVNQHRAHLATMSNKGGLKQVAFWMVQNEGLATFVPLFARLRDRQMSHGDYEALMDTGQLRKKTEELKRLLTAIPDDYPGDRYAEMVLDALSGERLSYIVGCEICRRMEEHAGVNQVYNAALMSPAEFVREGLGLL